MKSLLPVILILSGISAQSCIDCGPQAELTARIDFYGDSLKFDSAYALSAVSQEVIRRQTDNFTPGSYFSISLPISLVSDTTTYIFRSGERIDTLSIYYRRIFRYKGGCGFIADALEPARGNRFYSTFSTTEVYYDPYVLSGKQPWTNAESGAGISIRIEP